jgi:hypothetical protein
MVGSVCAELGADRDAATVPRASCSTEDLQRGSHRADGSDSHPHRGKHALWIGGQWQKSSSDCLKVSTINGKGRVDSGAAVIGS